MKQITAIILSSLVVVGFMVPSVSFGRMQYTAEMLDKALGQEAVTAQDLEVATPRLLPSSPFYFFKEIGRGIQQFFTFNPVKKAELKLKVADEKLIEAKTILEEKPENVAALKAAVETYEENIGDLRERLKKLQTTTQNPNVDKLLDKVVDRAIKHEKLFDELIVKAEGVSVESGEAIKPMMGKAFEILSVVSEKFDSPERFRGRLKSSFETKEVEGNFLAPLRSLEMIDRLEQKLPGARESIAPLRQTLIGEVKEAITVIESGSGSTGMVTPPSTGTGVSVSTKVSVSDLLYKLPGDPVVRCKVIKDIQAQVTVDTGSGMPWLDKSDILLSLCQTEPPKPDDTGTSVFYLDDSSGTFACRVLRVGTGSEQFYSGYTCEPAKVKVGTNKEGYVTITARNEANLGEYFTIGWGKNNFSPAMRAVTDYFVKDKNSVPSQGSKLFYAVYAVSPNWSRSAPSVFARYSTSLFGDTPLDQLTLYGCTAWDVKNESRPCASEWAELSSVIKNTDGGSYYMFSSITDQRLFAAYAIGKK